MPAPAPTPAPAPAPLPPPTAAEPPPSASSPARSNAATGPKSNADQAQISLADALYSRQQWDAAIPEYQRFINDFPRSPELPAALYRLADSYLKIGNNNSARLYWGKLAALPQPGAIGGATARRLVSAGWTVVLVARDGERLGAARL